MKWPTQQKGADRPVQVNDKLKGWPDFFPEATIPDALFQGEIQRAVEAEKFYTTRDARMSELGLDFERKVIESHSEISFAAALAAHSAAFLSPDDLQEVMEPMVASCIDHSEAALALREEHEPEKYKWRDGIMLYLGHSLIRQSVLFRAACLYPPENDAAARLRSELTSGVYARSKIPLPNLFKKYRIQQTDSSLRRSRRESLSGVVQEATMTALVNRENDPACLALPSSYAEDHHYKIDGMIVSYEAEGSFVSYLQSKGYSRREALWNPEKYDLPFQAVIHPDLLGNAFEPPTGSIRKTWATTLAIMSERIGTMNGAGRTDGIAEYLTEKRADVLDCVRKEAVAFPLRLWNTPPARS